MSAIADHLWQSTWFALAAALLAFLVRHEPARIRYWVWLAASLKFLFPFVLLGWIGRQLVFQVDDAQALLPIVQHVAIPLTTATPSVEHVGVELQQSLLAIWILGSIALLARWLLNLRRGRSLLRTSVPCAVIAAIPVRCSDRLAEPGVVGIVEPVLLMPASLASTLTRAQLETVISHEMWHVRRRDNLFSAAHALIEVLFWFHPLVWWIGAKLIDEREHACDEGVIQDGHDRATYAETLLRICRQSIESRIACMANATDGDLSARIRSIMLRRRSARFGAIRRTVLTGVLLGCFALPVASGVTVIVTSSVTVASGARSIRVTEASGPALVVVRDDTIYGRNVSMRELIGSAYSVRARDVMGNALWLDHPRYDVELRTPVDGSADLRALVADVLERQFNVELIVRPTLRAHHST